MLNKVINVKLPDLHEGQIKAWEGLTRYSAIRCGRRWGKTKFGTTIAADGTVKGQEIGWFAPDFRKLSEAYTDCQSIIEPVMTQRSYGRVIRTIKNGRIDFWSLDNEDAGRSRRYHGVIIDEAAFTKPNMMSIWEKSIKPTLLDFGGWAIVLSNTKGKIAENFFYQICNDPKYNFTEYHAPSWDNPLLPLRLPDETEAEWQERRDESFRQLKAENHPLVFAQEYGAEFVDWSGVAFFALEKLLDGGQPVDDNMRVDSVYVVIDTSMKSGLEHDGTAAMYFGYAPHQRIPLLILDWEIHSIDGAMLEAWLPGVIKQANKLAEAHNARLGMSGVHIEDKNSGTILIQQAQKKDLPVLAINSILTSLGKDERAINASPYVYQSKAKFTKRAYDKVMAYKEGIPKNHALSQILGFRVGDKDAAKRADDLLDTFCYGIALGLGDADGA